MNQTIVDHIDQCSNQLLTPEPKKKKYKFTLEYSDGSTSEVAFKSTSRKEAKRSLDYWCPGYETELGCKVTEL